MEKMEQIANEPPVQRTVKDPVFADLFCIPSYAMKLVNALHPQLVTTAKEVETVSLHSVLLAKPYNDLGLLVKNRLLILVEARAS